jgi:D-amino-acid dehydrogenase
MTSLPPATEIVVVGAGAIGASAAYALARDGHEVVLLDRGPVGMGASAGTACMVTSSHAERMASRPMLIEGIRFLPDPAGPFSLRPRPRLLPWLARFTAASLTGDAHAGDALLRRLAIESVDLHRAWSDALETGLVQAGTLNVYLSEAGLAGREEAVLEHRAAGMQVELLDAGDVLERQPAILGARGAAFYPEDAHVDSLRYTQRVAAGATRLGATVLDGVEVLGVARGATDLRIETTSGTIAARQLVLAAGVWSRRLARDLAITLPLQAAKGYHVEFEGLEHAVRQPVYLYETRVVATPLAGRLRLAGTLELGSDPDALGKRRVAAVVDAGARHIDGVAGARVSHVWRGLRPMSSDGMPIVGRTPADHRVIVATGHGSLGITLAPSTGELVATLAGGNELAPWLDALRPGRFHRLAGLVRATRGA